MTKPKQTKIGTVQSLLRRPSGASIEALCKATDWQAHSVRAALTHLRKAGHVIERTEVGNKNDGPVYRIAAIPETSR